MVVFVMKVKVIVVVPTSRRPAEKLYRTGF